MLTAARLSRLSRELSHASALSATADELDSAREREHRRAAGAFFTPPALVEFVVAETVGRRLRDPNIQWRRDGSPELVVLDPACGDGRFLEAAGELLLERAVARGADRRRARRAIRSRCLIGLERDPEFHRAACERLGDNAVHCCEALFEAPAQVADGVDIVVGNPPYLRSIQLGKVDRQLHRALRGKYAATSYGEWDLYAAFLEQSVAWLRPGGEAGLVVPSRWHTAQFASRLRAKLAESGSVRALVDFGAAQIFPGATTYASVAFLTRRRTQSVRVARYRQNRWSFGSVPHRSLGGEPWRISVGRDRELLERLATAGPTLESVARIAKGTGTNADPVFLFTRGDGKPTVEESLLELCLRGRDVVAYGRATRDVRCLVPYDRDGGLLSPDVLARRFPRAAAYLASARAKLEARERGRFRGDRYYCFGRPQNLAFLRDPAPKVVVPDVAQRGRALLDARGALVLDSAYAIRCSEGRDSVPLELILAVMNSRVVALWLKETGVPLRGGYLRLKTAYLRSLPLPGPGMRRDRICTAVRAGAGRTEPEAVDELVRQAYGISPAQWFGREPKGNGHPNRDA